MEEQRDPGPGSSSGAPRRVPVGERSNRVRWFAGRVHEVLDEVKEMVARRAVPQPTGPMHADGPLTNDARLDVPSTVICTGFPPNRSRRPSRRATTGSPASPSCATSSTSTSPPATGRCGHGPRSWPRSSARSRRRTPRAEWLALRPRRAPRVGRGPLRGPERAPAPSTTGCPQVPNRRSK